MANYFDSVQLDGWKQKEAIPYFFTRTPFFQKVFEGGNWEVQHGKTAVQWRVRLSGSNIRSYGTFETFTASTGGDFTTASAPWGRLVTTIAISGLEMERQGQGGDFMAGTLTPMHDEILRDLRDDFAWRLSTEFADGDGTDVNGGGGVGILGYKQSVAASPSTGTVYGISRVTVTDHRNQQFAATSGPSGSATQDAWWCVLNGKIQGSRQMGPRGRCVPDILVSQSGPLVMIKNKGFSQNTAVGASVNGIETIEGMELGYPDDQEASATVRLICSKVFKIISTQPKSKFFNLREESGLQNHIHEKDSAIVLRTPDFQLVNEFPKANVAITSFS